MRIEIDVGQRARLREPIGLETVTDASVGRGEECVAAQEATQTVVLRAGQCECCRPVSERVLAVESDRKVIAPLLQLGASRIVVRIGWQFVVHRVAVAEQEAPGRILRQDRQISIDAQARLSEVGLAPIQRVGAAELGALLAEATLLEVERQGLGVVADRWQAGRQRDTAATVHATADANRARRLTGRIVDHMDYADERGRPEHHRRRATQHLDLLDTGQVHRRRRWIERTAPGYVIDHQQKCVGLAQAP